ncbi:MAG: helix-turn-helix transcriptional regulator [Planctomycetota bacterium]|nr:helix-turn-helix transcriptional regulator [Planctomycetota bacterium]
MAKKTVDLLFDEQQLTVEDVAEKSGLDAKRVEAIATGRWTPSPTERSRMAAALGVTTDAISWGHTMDPRNIRYRQYGLKEDFQHPQQS